MSESPNIYSLRKQKGDKETLYDDVWSLPGLVARWASLIALVCVQTDELVATNPSFDPFTLSEFCSHQSNADDHAQSPSHSHCCANDVNLEPSCVLTPLYLESLIWFACKYNLHKNFAGLA